MAVCGIGASARSPPGVDVARLENLLEAARGAGSGPPAPDFQDKDTVTVLGQRREATCGRWTGGVGDHPKARIVDRFARWAR